jgi:hypothetical protein
MSQSIAADTHEARAGAGWPRALGGHLLTPSPQQSPSGTCLWEVAVSPRKSRPEPRQELLGEPRDWLLPREASMPPTAASSCTGPLCLPSVPPAPSVCLSLCVSSHLKLFLVHFHITAEPSLPLALETCQLGVGIPGLKASLALQSMRAWDCHPASRSCDSLIP